MGTEERGETEDEAGSASSSEAGDEQEDERETARRVFQQQERARRGPRQTLLQQRQQDFADMEWVRRQLAWWAGRCGICEAAGDGQSGHDIRRCWRAASQPAKEMIRRIEEKMRFDDYSGCFWCGVPQAICGRWEDNGRGGYRRAEGGNCQYSGVLVGGLMGLVYRNEGKVAERWCARLVEQGVEGGQVDELARYLGGKQQLECVESNRLVGEFCWITRLLAEQAKTVRERQPTHRRQQHARSAERRGGEQRAERQFAECAGQGVIGARRNRGNVVAQLVEK